MRRSSAKRTLNLIGCGIGAWVISACSSGSSPYQTTLTAADAAASNRRPEEAARLYQRAMREATKTDLAVEAAYREASMWKRQGHPARALTCLERLAAEHSASSRGPRIWLDLGRLRESMGDAVGARLAYGKVLNYPDSGLATRAADALVRISPGPATAAYQTLLPTAKHNPTLDGFLRLRIAQAEAVHGDELAAIASCERLAALHPLPTGVYTDDALLLAARLRRSLGDATGALVTLDALVAAQEKSTFVGSYERSAFAEARWLAADIAQFDLHDPQRAEKLLDDLVRLDSSSRLRDDALFRAAWLAHHERQDDGAACSRAQQLEELEPPSPLAECLGAVCSRQGRPAQLSHRCQRVLEPTPAESAPSESAPTDSAPTSLDPGG